MIRDIGKSTLALELSAQQILKALRLGKKIASIHDSSSSAVSFRNRVATLKYQEDKLLSLLALPDEPLSILSSIKSEQMIDDEGVKLDLWHLTMELGKKKENKKFPVLIFDDVQQKNVA